jgi:hypothetical protein
MGELLHEIGAGLPLIVDRTLNEGGDLPRGRRRRGAEARLAVFFHEFSFRFGNARTLGRGRFRAF